MKVKKICEDIIAMNYRADPIVLDWPQSLFCAVLGIEYISNNNLPIDMERTMDYVLDDLESNKQKSVILMKYKNGKTLQQISERMRISIEETKALEVTAFRILRRQKNLRILKVGLFRWRNGERLIVKDSKTATRERVNMLPLKAGKDNALKILEIENIFHSNHIQLLDIEPRACNALTRAGTETIDDLCTYTESELLKLRNLGKEGLISVIVALEKYGLKLQVTLAEETIAQKDNARQEVLGDDQKWKAEIASRIDGDIAQSLLKIKKDYGTIDLTVLEFNTRVNTALHRATIWDLELLCSYTPKQISTIRNIGVRSLAYLEAELNAHGLHLRNEE